jgi:hypothetical protein
MRFAGRRPSLLDFGASSLRAGKIAARRRRVGAGELIELQRQAAYLDSAEYKVTMAYREAGKE